MRPLLRAAALLASALVVANCAQTPQAMQMSRSAPDAAAPEVARAAPSERDLSCLAEAVYFEARGTGPVGESAVAHVVVNRAQAPAFPNSICGVVGDGCQFSYRCDGHSDALAEPGSRARAFKVAETVLSGAPDITGGALFFHSARVAPGWFKTRPRVGTFGGNVFYR
ncbi:cell wall hydrolase [Amaricoccus sp.]|uniref:cell wall hydrolase n=1 Tax=Amaricoccus sp. TaxID=1872485 RepID=UPI00261EBEC2|nr:cell wall hydrolase [Amaricoccus sp.]HRO10333.1 cell wall hydrolase [Amaricoccus sp.]